MMLTYLISENKHTLETVLWRGHFVAEQTMIHKNSSGTQIKYINQTTIAL